jgi:hypothetical protein
VGWREEKEKSENTELQCLHNTPRLGESHAMTEHSFCLGGKYEKICNATHDCQMSTNQLGSSIVLVLHKQNIINNQITKMALGGGLYLGKSGLSEKNPKFLC